MALVREIGIAVRIVIITLWLQSAGIAALIHWVRHALASDANRLGPFRSAVLYSCAAHGRGNRSTWSIDSILGELLSLALLLVLGVCPLLLGQQLCHRVLWRRSPTVKLGHARAAGEHHWRLDVRNIGERTVSDNHSARPPRCAILLLIGNRGPAEDGSGDEELSCPKTPPLCLLDASEG